MASGRNKRQTLPVHRLGLTHGQEGVPKFNRENSEQFFAAATRRKSKILSASRPIIATESQPKKQSNKTNDNKKQNNKTNDNEKQENLFPMPSPKPSTPVIVLPPIRVASSTRSKSMPSASACIHQPTLPLFTPSPSDSLESPTPLTRPTRRRFHHQGPVDQDIFRKAYERAISVARSRLLFRDPYSLTRASATHGILYSYYDHTPMCVFSRGTACNHRQDETNKDERKTKSDLSRKHIFNDVVVEHYIQ